MIKNDLTQKKKKKGKTVRIDLLCIICSTVDLTLT